MTDHAARVVLVSACGVCGLLGLGARAAAATPSPTPVSAAATPSGIQTVTATVRSVDESARTVDLLTGVGHALRMVRISVAEGCQIRVRAAVAGIRDLRPGHICRVQFRRTGPRNVAERIEVQGAAAGP